MVPIHESDVAEERWLKAEWENYELWEKVEVRLKRQKRLWILATALVFLALSAVPIALDHWPKWITRNYARILAQEVNHLKRDAGIEHAAFRMTFTDPEKLELTVEKVTSCSDSKGTFVRTVVLGSQPPVPENGEGTSMSRQGLAAFFPDHRYAFVSPEAGNSLGVPGILQSFCYDPLTGSHALLQGDQLVGFGIVPTEDLSSKRIDRITLLLLSGASAEVAFD